MNSKPVSNLSSINSYHNGITWPWPTQLKLTQLFNPRSLGKTKPIKPSALAQLFELVSDQIRCVVLNACYSESQAQAIVKHIPFVIGMTQSIGDGAAISFSTGFYRALGAGCSFEDAYKFGLVELELEDVSKDTRPMLYVNSQVLEAQIFAAKSGLSSQNWSNDDPTGDIACAIGVHLYYEKSDFSGALEFLLRVTEKSTRYATAQRWIGHNIYGRKWGLWNEGIPYLEEAYRVSPQDPKVLEDIGRAYIRVGRRNRGIDFLHQADTDIARNFLGKLGSIS